MIWMYINMRGYTALLLDTNFKTWEQLVIRNDMDVNEDERLYNITLGHKLKQTNNDCNDVLHLCYSRVVNNEQGSSWQ
jgi:hypothetical protein